LEEEEKRAQNLALRYLARFAVPAKKLISYLERKGIDKPTAEKVAQHFQKEGYLNDFEYACAFVRRKKEKFGSRKIFAELLKKGIPQEIASEALESFTEEEEREVLKNLISFYRQKNAQLDEDTFKKKLVGFLVRRGFKQNLILNLIRQWEIGE